MSNEVNDVEELKIRCIVILGINTGFSKRSLL
jgi:hypothetical protein